MPTRTSGLVLAAGGSSRLGRPKQLLPFGDATLLDHTLGVARACGFDQLVCVLGGAADEVRGQVDLRGVEVVVNEGFGTGCSSSIAAALPQITGDVLVLLLGDQPGVAPASVAALLQHRADLAVCRYDDGRGHPFAFSRAVFDQLAALHGDKGVWKLLDRAGAAVVEVTVPGSIPPDIDTWDDYERAVASLPPDVSAGGGG
jgi:molybdenum cofactor cytidylyltransferase